MKKLLYTAFFLLSLANFASGQLNYQITPIPASITGTVDEPDVEADAEIRNLTGDTLKLKWVRNVISITSGCETAVCDPITCYSRAVSTRNFNLLPNITKPLLVHFYNNGAPCQAIVHLKVTNNNNAADSTTAVYLYNQSSSGVKDLPVANVVVFPNPATDFFSLENSADVAAIRLYALDGQLVERFEVAASNFYSVKSQPKGTYVIALEDKNGELFQAMELIRQ
jgi:hypothetical protein